MIVAERKPLDEIITTLEGARDILVAGCGTCVAVCMAGGQQEAALLASELRVALKLRGFEANVVDATAQRQCDDEFIDELAEVIAGKDVIVSTACGAGVQFLARHYEPTRVIPALNTEFIGVTLERGSWVEYCQACGDCVLDITGGICPIARCSKSLLNGPCGGSSGGKCEINDETECAWQLIHDRLRAQGRLHQIEAVIEPKNWRTSRDGGPRRVSRKSADGLANARQTKERRP